MARPLVSDELWELIEPLIPKVPRRHRFPGRKRIDDRKVLTGILFVLRTGIPWEYLQQEMGCGSGVTCWRRLIKRRSSQIERFNHCPNGIVTFGQTLSGPQRTKSNARSSFYIAAD